MPRASWPPLPLALAFFLSGVAALIYELLWFRLLGHVLGSTAAATATLLSAYLFGLGAGAWVFGRLSDRLPRLALVYVAIEVGIGAYGLASAGLLERGATLYALAHAWAGDSGGRLLLARFAVSFVLIAIPTTLMGGTFPLMVHLLRDRYVDVGRATGRAYAINTAGAAAGALGLPSLLLPSLGVRRTLALAATANVAAALAVALHARRTSAASPEAVARPEPAAAGDVPAAALLAGFFLSSFASLALETVWSRQLGIFFGPQIHVFAFVLFAYLLGLFLGGALYARLVARGARPATLLRAGLVLAAAGVAATLPFLDRLSIPQIEMMLAVGVGYRSFLTTCALEVTGLVLPAAVGFGLVFPAVVDGLARPGRRAGRSVGLAYVVNTLGTTLGAAAAGFVLVPALGTQRTLEVAVLCIAGALALSWAAPGGRRRGAGLAVAASFAAVLAFPRWDWRLAHAMYAKDPLLFLQKYTHGLLRPMLAGLRVSFLAEGAQATASVCDYGTTGFRALFVNGKPDASNFPEDMVTQRLLGYVPALFHPAPRRALVIGVGSGTTAGSLEQFPLEAIDAAEISPQVVAAAVGSFADVNGRFLDDRRLALHLDDGRNFLRFAPPGSYDIVISEPSNAWMAGVSALFTDEFFADVRAKLRPGGIFCQWFYYSSSSLEHVKLVVRTFSRHFPESAILALHGEGPVGDLLLVGANGPLRLPRFPDDPSVPAAARAGLVASHNGDAARLLVSLVAGPGDAAAFAGDGPVNTDDRPLIEFEAPADRFLPSPFFDNLRAMMTARARLFLPAGPLASESDAAAEVARDGLAPTRGLPPGVEVRRGATVLTRVSPGRDTGNRWVLLGREFVDGEVTTGLHRLASPAGGPAEIVDVATTLAGDGEPAGRGDATVNGHAAVWTALDEGGSRTVALGWMCPEAQRTFLVSRRAPVAGAPPPSDVAADLAARFPCAH